MSMHESPDTLSAVDFNASPLNWAAGLGRYTRRRRVELGLTIERAAKLAGLELSQWCALESGWVPDPDDMNRIEAIAATLQIFWGDYSFLILMATCQQGPPEKDFDQP